MNLERVKKLADALLYEGYILYPYRASAIKNQQRFNFGVIAPPGTRDSSVMQTECLVHGGRPAIAVQVRFLQIVSRQACRVLEPAIGAVDDALLENVGSLSIDGDVYSTWDEGIERDLTIENLWVCDLVAQAQRREAAWESSESRQQLLDRHGSLSGIFRRRQAALRIAVTVSAAAVSSGLFRVTVEIANLTVGEESPLALSLVSAHTILAVSGARFVSLLEPEDEFEVAAAECNNLGTWPVLVGDRGRRDLILSSPIILYDYPQIAPESGGDYFDGTEIDEMLALRVRTLTESEKREMRHVDERARRILHRAEAMDEAELGTLHGAVRQWSAERLESRPRLKSVACRGVNLGIGSRVRLRPKRSADVMDIVLRGQIATIEAIEQDYEENVHLAVVIDNDPGRDLGLQRLPGHRFFYSLDEVEPLDEF